LSHVYSDGHAATDPHPSFNPPKGILFIVTLPFPLQTARNALIFAFFSPQMPSGRPQMAEKGLILHFRACPHAPKTGGMLGILPPPYPHRCRFVALYPPHRWGCAGPKIRGSPEVPRPPVMLGFWPETPTVSP
jgi:hypothetical protein